MSVQRSRPSGRRKDRDRLSAKRSLLWRLAAVSIGVVTVAVVVAGIGVRQFAYVVIVQGDMMTTDKLPDFLRQTSYYLLGTTLVTALVAALVSWYLSRQIIRPLSRIREVAAAVASGDYSHRLNERRTDELGELARDIDQMTDSLARVEQMRRGLVANVAHELRTPLTSTQGLIHAMRDGLLPASAENLEQVAEEVARLIRLVEAIHQLSLSDAVPRGGLSAETVDLSRTAADVLSGMMLLFEHKSISVTFEPKAKDLLVRADRDALVRVLVNLLDNAAKYTPAGGWVRLETGAGGEVAVCNSGPGIPSDDLPHIFERFYRSDRARSREIDGSGIGLALVKNLVYAMEGRVWAESQDGTTCFRVALPPAN